MTHGTRECTGETSVHWMAKHTLLLPDGPVPPGGFPLFVALHGARESGAMLRERLEDGRSLPFARLYPDGPFPVEIREGEEWRIGYTWYHYNGDADALNRALAFGIDHLAHVVDGVADAHGLDRSRIVLFGYSQGGYLASFAALRQRERYRALVSASCRIKTEILEDDLRGARGYRVLVVHGERDRLTAITPQATAVEVLEQHGLDVQFLRHPRGHGLPREVVPNIMAFVRDVLGV